MPGDDVELCFYCPVKREVYRTAQWETAGCVTVERDHMGTKRLQGSITAACPLCSGTHVFMPDELPCPLMPGVDGRGEG